MTGVVAGCARLHRDIDALAAADRSLDAGGISTRAASLVAAVGAACQARGITPEHLGARARRAFGWAAWLSEPEHARLQLEATAALHRAAAAARDGARDRLRLELAPVSVLYRVRRQPGATSWVVNLGFVQAPPPIVAALAGAAFGRRWRQPLGVVREYALSRAYAEVVAAVESAARGDGQSRPTQPGRHVDLALLFEAVNATYFRGGMRPPRLEWGRATRRKLGHYDPHSDAVVISRSLDSPGTPRYVLEYIMYHELVHRLLGVEVVGGRRRAHTPAFRRLEGQFRDLGRVREWLGTGWPDRLG